MQGKIETEFGKILIDTDVIATYARKFDSSINQKTLTGPIKPVFFCQF